MTNHERELRRIIEKQLKMADGKPVAMTVVQYQSKEDASVPDEQILDWEAYLDKYDASISILKEYGVDVFELDFSPAEYAKYLQEKGFVDTRAIRAMWAQTRV